MRPTFIVRVSGTRPHAFDVWTKPYKAQHTAAGQATRLTQRSRDLAGDFVARIYRLGTEDYRGPDPGPVLRLVQVIR